MTKATRAAAVAARINLTTYLEPAKKTKKPKHKREHAKRSSSESDSDPDLEFLDFDFTNDHELLVVLRWCK